MKEQAYRLSLLHPDEDVPRDLVVKYEAIGRAMHIIASHQARTEAEIAQKLTVAHFAVSTDFATFEATHLAELLIMGAHRDVLRL